MTGTSEAKWVANDGVAATPLGDRLALLNLSESTYYTMNPVAAAVWAKLGAPQSVRDLAQHVCELFETGEADAEGDMIALLADLARLKLVRAFVD